MKTTHVYLKTKKEYNECMKIFEKIGWRWNSGEKPTKYNAFQYYEGNICVTVGDCMTFDTKNACEAMFRTVISFSEMKKQLCVSIKNESKRIKKQVKKNPYWIEVKQYCDVDLTGMICVSSNWFVIMKATNGRKVLAQGYDTPSEANQAANRLADNLGLEFRKEKK